MFTMDIVYLIISRAMVVEWSKVKKSSIVTTNVTENRVIPLKCHVNFC
jgi:hypothetical protein